MISQVDLFLSLTRFTVKGDERWRAGIVADRLAKLWSDAAPDNEKC